MANPNQWEPEYCGLGRRLLSLHCIITVFHHFMFSELTWVKNSSSYSTVLWFVLYKPLKFIVCSTFLFSLWFYKNNREIKVIKHFDKYLFLKEWILREKLSKCKLNTRNQVLVIQNTLWTLKWHNLEQTT